MKTHRGPDFEHPWFKIIKKCNSNFETEIDEALLIKKHNPKLNRQLFANRSSFLLNILDYYFVSVGFARCIGVVVILAVAFKFKLIFFMREKNACEKKDLLNNCVIQIIDFVFV